MNFKYNDGGRSKYFKASRVGDCSVRAIAIATNQDYKQVYNDLKKLNNGVSCRNGTPKEVSKKYLLSKGWIWVGINRRDGDYCRLSEEFFSNNKTYIASVSKHLTAIVNGVINDTYDCSKDGERTVYGYYIKGE